MRVERIVEEVFSKALEARSIISQYVHRTPVDHSATFSKISGSRVYLKYENLQKTGSFKVRGALYKVHLLKEAGVEGVVAASAGNHAQGVAYASLVHGIASVVVMPENAPLSKVDAALSYGAEVVLHGSTYDEAQRRAEEISEERGYPLVHPFNDIDVIAGNGTIALELLEQLGDVDVVVVPVGGGGLISGIACILRKRRSRVRIVGVEPKAAPKVIESLKAGRPVEVEVRPSIADGLLAKKPGDLTYTLISELVDDVVSVDEEEIAHSIYLSLERSKVLVEGAGAAGIAAVLSGKVKARDKRVAVIVSGGNIDLNSLYKVLLRGLAKAGKIARLTGYVPDYPGELKRVLDFVASYRANIIDIMHDRSNPGLPPWHAKVSILVEVARRDIAEAIVRDLRDAGYSFEIEE